MNYFNSIMKYPISPKYWDGNQLPCFDQWICWREWSRKVSLFRDHDISMHELWVILTFFKDNSNNATENYIATNSTVISQCSLNHIWLIQIICTLIRIQHINTITDSIINIYLNVEKSVTYKILVNNIFLFLNIYLHTYP